MSHHTTRLSSIGRPATWTSFTFWWRHPRRFTETKITRYRLEKRLSFNVQSALGISCNVKLVGPREIERSEGKAKRVIDKRG